MKKQTPNIEIEQVYEAKVIIKAYLEGMPIDDIMELVEYEALELWLGTKKAFLWLDMLAATDPAELEKYLEEED